jgi:hypothetical protein
MEFRHFISAYTKYLTNQPQLLKKIAVLFWEIGNNIIYNPQIEEKPLFIFGNQKSGTTVIAILLSKLSGMSATLDLTKENLYPDYDKLMRENMSFDYFINKNRIDFSKKIIKDPFLALFYNKLRNRYKHAKFIFIIRDPRDNIRSILNRLKLPGTIESLNEVEFKKYGPGWKLALNNEWLGINSNNIIMQLSHRWNYYYNIYKNNMDNLYLIKYEDFVANKVGIITEICHKFSLPIKNDITHKVNLNYNIKGDNKRSLEKFFGKRNLLEIEKICKEGMNFFNYS